MDEVFLSFTIPLRAVPKARPRLGKWGTVFTPQKTRDFERAVGLYAHKEMVSANKVTIRAGTPVGIRIVFTFKTPKRPSNSYPTIQDLDNCLKSVLDGFNNIVFEDDAQICMLESLKRYGEEDKIDAVILI